MEAGGMETATASALKAARRNAGPFCPPTPTPAAAGLLAGDGRLTPAALRSW